MSRGKCERSKKADSAVAQRVLMDCRASVSCLLSLLKHGEMESFWEKRGVCVQKKAYSGQIMSLLPISSA